MTPALKTKDPWWRGTLCTKNRPDRCPNYPDCTPLHEILDGGEGLSEWRRAAAAYFDEKQRDLLQPWFFARTPFEVLQRTLSFSARAAAIYSQYFFDVSVFADDIEKLAWLDSVPTAAQELFRVAYYGGIPALCAVFARGTPRVDATSVLHEVTAAASLDMLRTKDPRKSVPNFRQTALALNAAQSLAAVDTGGSDQMAGMLLRLRRKDRVESVPRDGAKLLTS